MYVFAEVRQPQLGMRNDFSSSFWQRPNQPIQESDQLPLAIGASLQENALQLFACRLAVAPRKAFSQPQNKNSALSKTIQGMKTGPSNPTIVAPIAPYAMMTAMSAERMLSVI